ncbi:MAG: single-stranded DNA-binding protein, partial [Odoribacter splanchnicus]|nr:single-stranded DNA-binding protein [Odoribacter splanchnicus]
TTEIWADNMQMLSFKQDNGDGGNAPSRGYNAPASSAVSSVPDEDDLPF